MFLIMYDLVGPKTFQCLHCILISNISIKNTRYVSCIKYVGECCTENQIESSNPKWKLLNITII